MQQTFLDPGLQSLSFSFQISPQVVLLPFSVPQNVNLPAVSHQQMRSYVSKKLLTFKEAGNRECLAFFFFFCFNHSRSLRHKDCLGSLLSRCLKCGGLVPPLWNRDTPRSEGEACRLARRCLERKFLFKKVKFYCIQVSKMKVTPCYRP